MTTQTLIALVDGSAYSESLCHYAGWIAARAGAGVKLYHVLPKSDADDQRDLSGAIRLGARSRLMDRLSALDAERAGLAHEHGRAILDDAQALVASHGVPVETRLRHGDLIDTVTRKEDGGSLILIGKRGEAADLAAGHLGSNLERIVRAAHHPVFVANRAFHDLHRVLIAYDGGASADRAVDHIAASPVFAGLDLTLVQVGDTTPSDALMAARTRLSEAGHQVRLEARAGEPEHVLAEMTEPEGSHDLLVMGAYGHSRIRSLLVGSTTTQMVRSCRVPVLLFR